MNRSVLLALVASGVSISLAAAGLSLSLQTGFSYWPFKVGNRWTIETTIAGQKKVQTIAVTKVSTAGGKTTAVLDYKTDGIATQLETYRLDATGLFRLSSGPGGSNTISPPFPVIMLPLTSGKKWTWKGSIMMNGAAFQGECTCTASGPAPIKTPAGTFRAWKIHVDLIVSTGGQKVPLKNDYFFAPGVGLIRQVMTTGGMSVEGTLSSFKLAK